MNNAARGLILGFALFGTAVMFVIMVSSIDDGSSSSEFTLENLANVLAGGFGMVACAVIAGAALLALTPSQTPPKTVMFPGTVLPQGQQPQGQYPYPQQAPQQHAAPPPYGQQQPQG